MSGSSTYNKRKAQGLEAYQAFLTPQTHRMWKAAAIISGMEMHEMLDVMIVRYFQQFTQQDIDLLMKD